MKGFPLGENGDNRIYYGYLIRHFAQPSIFLLTSHVFTFFVIILRFMQCTQLHKEFDIIARISHDLQLQDTSAEDILVEQRSKLQTSSCFLVKDAC